MSRKLRVPKGGTEALPSPAWTFVLLTGIPAPVRICWMGEAGERPACGASRTQKRLAADRDALIALADASTGSNRMR